MTDFNRELLVLGAKLAGDPEDVANAQIDQMNLTSNPINGAVQSLFGKMMPPEAQQLPQMLVQKYMADIKRSMEMSEQSKTQDPLLQANKRMKVLKENMELEEQIAQLQAAKSQREMASLQQQQAMAMAQGGGAPGAEGAPDGGAPEAGPDQEAMGAMLAGGPQPGGEQGAPEQQPAV